RVERPDDAVLQDHEVHPKGGRPTGAPCVRCVGVARKLTSALLVAAAALVAAPLALAHGREDGATILVHFVPGADVHGDVASQGDKLGGRLKTGVYLVRLQSGESPDTSVA